MQLKRHVLALAILSMTSPTIVWATNGYFAHGYGLKAKGRAGAAVATHDDAFFGANNPAAAAFAGKRIDLGADLFSPIRKASRSGLGPGLDGSVESDSNYFVIPEFGYVTQMSPNLALGVTVYGNGGLNTDYPRGQFNCGMGPANMLCGNGRLGVDLMQLIVAPTVAYKLSADHAVGLSPLVGYQRFRAEGLQAFASVSSDSANLTNRGYDSSFGFGVRVGYQGRIAPGVTVGAAYASKMNFDEFDKYRGLFANRGEFDIPEHYALGIAVQATPQVRLALDYQRINYSDVRSVGNPSTNPAQLGAANGPGFGWKDVNIWKLGVEYQHSKALTLRAGWNHGDNPIRARDVTFNILAPGVIQDHLTLGFTYSLPSGNELTVSYMHAFSNDVKGASILPVFMGGSPTGNEKIEMYQNAIGVQYSWKL
ncbi:MAG: outer membrane protein transport protein [Anaerolineae bacterium]|nr:outer membrane protein transport protein [Anaerolineae bacterium]